MSTRAKFWDDRNLPKFSLWWTEREKNDGRKKLICAACGDLYSLRSMPEHIRKTHIHKKCLQIAKCVNAECVKNADMFSAIFITDHLLRGGTHEIITAKESCKHRISCQQLYDDILELSVGMGFFDSNYQRWGSTRLQEELQNGTEFYQKKRDQIKRFKPLDEKACFVQKHDDGVEQRRESERYNGISTSSNGRSPASPGRPSSPGRTPSYDCRSPAYARSPAASRSNSRASSPYGNYPNGDISSAIREGGRSPGYDECNTRMGEHTFMMDEDDEDVPVPSKQTTIDSNFLRVKKELVDDDQTDEDAGGRPSMPLTHSYTSPSSAAHPASLASLSMQHPSSSHSSTVTKWPSFSASNQQSMSSSLPPPRPIQPSSSTSKRTSRFDQPPAYHSSDISQNDTYPVRLPSTYGDTPTPPPPKKPSFAYQSHLPPQLHQTYSSPATPRPPTQSFYPSRDPPYNGGHHYAMTSNGGMNYAPNFENGAPIAPQREFDRYPNSRSSYNSHNYNNRETFARTTPNSDRTRYGPTSSHRERKPPLNNSLFSDEADYDRKNGDDRNKRRC